MTIIMISVIPDWCKVGYEPFILDSTVLFSNSGQRVRGAVLRCSSLLRMIDNRLPGLRMRDYVFLSPLSSAWRQVDTKEDAESSKQC